MCRDRATAGRVARPGRFANADRCLAIAPLATTIPRLFPPLRHVLARRCHAGNSAWRDPWLSLDNDAPHHAVENRSSVSLDLALREGLQQSLVLSSADVKRNKQRPTSLGESNRQTIRSRDSFRYRTARMQGMKRSTDRTALPDTARKRPFHGLDSAFNLAQIQTW